MSTLYIYLQLWKLLSKFDYLTEILSCFGVSLKY